VIRPIFELPEAVGPPVLNLAVQLLALLRQEAVRLLVLFRTRQIDVFVRCVEVPHHQDLVAALFPLFVRRKNWRSMWINGLDAWTASRDVREIRGLRIN
jgi:hypothetical protein